MLTSSRELALLSGSNTLPTLTRLRTFCLYNIAFTQLALTNFLEASPYLSKLVLARYTYSVPQGQDLPLQNQPNGNFDQGLGIIRIFSTHYPDLKSLHLSLSLPLGGIYGQNDGGAKHIVEAFPHMEELNFTETEFTPSLLKSLSTAVLNRITTLNLLPLHASVYPRRDIPLREILSTFVHLLNPRAPLAIYYLEVLDLHDVREQLRLHLNRKCHDLCHDRQYPPIPTDDPAVAQQYIWACRGLRTLHMEVSTRGSPPALPRLR